MQLEQFLEQSAATLPDKVALVCSGQRLTYRELNEAANRLANAWREAGVQRGDRVAIYLDNSAEAVISLFAALKAGAVFLLLNPTVKPDKLQFVLNNSRAVLLVLPGRRVPVLGERFDLLPHLRIVTTIGEPVRSGDSSDQPAHAPHAAGLKWLTYEACQQSFPVTTPPKTNINIDLAALIYTSGSTGNPKGVMLTHLNMVSASTSITTYLENRPDDIILNVLPISFDYGLYQVLMAFQIGATVILEKSFAYPHAILQAVVRERVTGFPLVPTMAALLLEMDLSSYDFSHLRYLTNTAAALPTEHIQRLRQLFPQARLYSMYGLTECKRVSYLPPEQLDIRPNSVGRGMPNEEVYLVDEAGQRLPNGATGTLVVRGANVMVGYWENPDATAQMLRPGPLPGERLLYTGDLFRTDEDGYLYFVGRKDDIIKSRGEKVAPREVENALSQHPAVAEAAVFGIPDPILGQKIKAVVVLRQGSQVTPIELQRFCAARLEDYMVPQLVEIASELPKSANGKVDKKVLIANAAD